MGITWQVLLDLLRRAAGPEWRPSEIHLEGPCPAHAERLAALARGPVHFGTQADMVVVPRDLLGLPLPPTAARRATDVLPETDFVDSIRVAIRALLALGEVSLSGVAEAAGTSARSLQRELAVSRLSFAQLLADARFELAARLLRDSSLRIIDVSEELGYSNSANFTRAFRRWAGVSPIRFRRAGALGPTGSSDSLGFATGTIASEELGPTLPTCCVANDGERRPPLFRATSKPGRSGRVTTSCGPRRPRCGPRRATRRCGTSACSARRPSR